MTINYTTLLGLAKPVTGTESGQWGDVVNDQITTLVEDAVANASSISVTAGNVTLTTTTGAANQARMSTLIITGSPGTTRNVVAPSQAKVYVVINQSNAAVVVKGAATTGVTIGAGQTAQIAWNGSDFVEIGNYVHGNFVVNGNLSVNGNSTLGDGGADITTINGQFVGANANISKATTLSTSAPAFFWLEGATYTDTGTAGGTTQPHATFHQIDAPTVNTSNIVTYTNASTLYIAGAPSAAGSATITNPYALFINGGASYFGAAVTMAATTQNLALGTSQTSGTWTAGGAAQTGTLTLDQSTKAHTLNLGTGATENLTTKTINLGTAGVSGSTTAINIGSAVSGATNSITVNGNPIFNSGTANGVLYLNGSKVATSGSALTFDGTNFATTGTSSAAKLIPTGGTATGNGMYLPAANTLAWSNNGAETMRLDSSGNLGIGTSSPATKLHVAGTFRQNDATSTYGYTVTTASSKTVTAALFGGGYFAWQTNNSGTDQLILDASGNLGLGVTPSAWSIIKAIEIGSFRNSVFSDNGSASVGIASGSYYNAGWKYALTGSAVGRYELAGNEHRWFNAPSGTAGNAISFTQAMTLDASGNLGLGVTPSAWGSNYKAFESAGNAAVVLAAANVNGVGIASNTYNDNTNWIYKTTGAAARYSVNTGVHQWYTAPSGTAGNAISFTQAMTLNASGNLGLGTVTGPAYLIDATAPSSGDTTIRLTKNGSVNTTINAVTGALTFGIDGSGGTTERARITSGGALLVGTTGISSYRFEVTSSGNTGLFQTTSGTSWPCISWSTATTGDNLFYGFFTEGTATERGRIDYNRAGGLTRYNTTSDYRAKDIIGPVQNPGATIDALKVYEGKMKGATQSRPMLIAHEAQQHAPYAVSGVKDEVNEDGTPKFQQMDVSSLVPLLLAEIQSLRARVAALESQP